MTTSDIISSCSIFISIGVLIYSHYTNTKKYELTKDYRTEILEWYSETIEIVQRLIVETKTGSKDPELKKVLLSKLSSKIEVGRFYFPNVVTGDKFGEKKPLAYRGYRNLVIDFLVFIYRIQEREDSEKYLIHMKSLSRHFTSTIFEILNPRSFVKETKKQTNQFFSTEILFEELLKDAPELLESHVFRKNLKEVEC